jgi:hypothetical protein
VTAPTPNPGSLEAIVAGCRCPVMDNGHGRGYLGGVLDPETGEPVFVIAADCPLHGGVREGTPAS